MLSPCILYYSSSSVLSNIAYMSAVRLFDGTEDTLEEIYLSHNMLGDNLNPVFSTDEFRNLKYLRVLDLSYNGLAGISEGLITGCDELKVGASSSWTLQIFYFVSTIFL